MMDMHSAAVPMPSNALPTAAAAAAAGTAPTSIDLLAGLLGRVASAGTGTVNAPPPAPPLAFQPSSFVLEQPVQQQQVQQQTQQQVPHQQQVAQHQQLQAQPPPQQLQPVQQQQQPQMPLLQQQQQPHVQQAQQQQQPPQQQVERPASRLSLPNTVPELQQLLGALQDLAVVVGQVAIPQVQRKLTEVEQQARAPTSAATTAQETLAQHLIALLGGAQHHMPEQPPQQSPQQQQQQQQHTPPQQQQAPQLVQPPQQLQSVSSSGMQPTLLPAQPLPLEGAAQEVVRLLSQLQQHHQPAQQQQGQQAQLQLQSQGVLADAMRTLALLQPLQSVASAQQQ